MITAGIWVIIVSLVVITGGVALRLTRDTGTHAAPRRQPAPVDEPAPPEWLPAPTWPPPVAHEEDWQAALDERHSGVIVANVYHPSPPPPPGDYQWREPFAWWLSDTNVGGMLAITAGGK